MKIDLAEFPEYAEARGRLVQMQTELNAAEQDRQTLLAILNASTNGGIDRSDDSHWQRVPDEVRERIEATLTKYANPGSDLAERVAAGESVAEVLRDRRVTDDLRADYKRLSEECSVLRRACELQRRKLSEITGEVSRQICAQLKPEYIDLLQRVAEKAMELAALTEREREFRDKLEAANILFTATLPPMPLTSIGRLRDPNSGINRWCEEARQRYGINIPGTSRA